MASVPTITIEFTGLEIFEAAVTALKTIFEQGHDYYLHPEYGNVKQGETNLCGCCIAEEALTAISEKMARLNKVN